MPFTFVLSVRKHKRAQQQQPFRFVKLIKTHALSASAGTAHTAILLYLCATCVTVHSYQWIVESLEYFRCDPKVYLYLLLEMRVSFIRRMVVWTVPNAVLSTMPSERLEYIPFLFVFFQSYF